MADLKRLQLAVEVGDRETAVEVTQQAIDEQLPPKTVLDAMTDAMGVVGQRFQDQEIYVPEMLISARAMKAAVALLEPLLVGSGYVPDKIAVMGTIKGDLHDIGKNLVGMMLRGASFEIVDLGTNVTVDRFMAAAREHRADLIGISALLTTTMGNMRGVIEAVRAADDMPNLRVIVGGAAVTSEFAQHIGADGWAPDAGSAVVLALRVVAEARAAAGIGAAAAGHSPVAAG
ncbi:MAG TPA: corrinoid protein [Candidatus Sulfomarinibacteraceae bacterium]|nr:corrinoid protein [Candidatus Sulfomarinibacteraceae bacterium]